MVGVVMKTADFDVAGVIGPGLTSASDATGRGCLNRFATLWPAMEGGATYRFPFSSQAHDPEGFITEALSDLHPDDVAYARGSIYRVEGDEQTTTVKKNYKPGWLMRSRPAVELDPDAVELLQAASYPRVPATLLGSEAKQRRLAEATHDFADEQVGPQHLAHLGEVVVSGYGQVHPDEHTVVEESFANAHHRPTRGLLQRCGETDWYRSTMDLTPAEDAVVDGPCLLLKQSWDANFGHWLVDDFARIATVGEHLDLSEVTVLVNHQPSEAMTRVVLDSLALVGVPAEHVRVHGTHPIRVRDACYPTPVSQVTRDARPPLSKHPAAIDFLAGLAEAARAAGGVNHAPHGRVLLTRRNVGRRALANEDELWDELLEPAGYTAISPEQLSLADQIVTAASATHLVGTMGAAFTTIAFAPEGVHVACLATPGMDHDYFYDLTCLRRGHYLGIQGTGDPDAPLTDDFVVDLELARQGLAGHGFC